MGLLSNFRKQSAAVEAGPTEETPALDFEFGDEPAPFDEQWLQAVDRRKSAPSAEDVDPLLTGVESDVAAAAPASAFSASPFPTPTAPAAHEASAGHEASAEHEAHVAADGYTISNHAPPATLMSTAHSDPLSMNGPPDFPTETPPASLHEQLNPTPAFESYDLLEPEDPPVAYAYAEEFPKEIVEVQATAETRSDPQLPPPVESEPEELPNMGMVFAGLSSHGIIPPAPPVAPPAPPQVAPIDIGFGPLGPQAVPHLQTMGLTVGVSWPQVTQARRTLMEENPADGTAEQQYRRTEVNHASASLRLLRVGPLLTA